DNLADAVVVDGNLIYQSGKQYNLKPVVAEVYDQGMGTSYYAVAVVRKNSTITINSLKGTKSCHTGLQKTAGWNVPIGFLIDSGRMSAMACDIQKGVASFFSRSCVPGADKALYPSLCELCKGAGHYMRLNNATELYQDYNGAFRCLVEKLPKFLRWCTLSTQEVWKCAAMAMAFKNQTLYPSIHCVSAENQEECMKMIQ
ncbi:hypothetical protein AB205_0132450, partial [Aquarana catesbeiana]